MGGFFADRVEGFGCRMETCRAEDGMVKTGKKLQQFFNVI